MSVFDEVGYWTEIKLDIVKKYAAAYSRILAAQTKPRFHHVYMDAFAGPGLNIFRETKKFIPGSPLNALWVEPPFREYFFIDIEGEKVEVLKEVVAGYPNVHVFPGDCNEILLSKVFPNVRYDDYRRGLCLLDPYGLHLDWKVIEIAGRMKSVEIFLNFPIGDMNRNVLRKDPAKVAPSQIRRMNRYWGDESWREIAYLTVRTLFGEEQEKACNDRVAAAFRDRLNEVAGFEYVPTPMPMRNTRGATIYYLFFAANKPVAAKIVRDIFDKYRRREA